MLVIPANSDHRSEAQKFLDFATSSSALLLAAQRGNPPLKAVLEDPAYQKVVSFSAVQLKSLSNARPRPRTRYWKQVEAVLGRCLSTLYESPEADPQRILRTANTAIETVLHALEKNSRDAFVDAFTCREDSGI
jgi:ABC-type glycerol-3-phosphate transport system substrate-binding protein